jgi:hypothetical protein
MTKSWGAGLNLSPIMKEMDGKPQQTDLIRFLSSCFEGGGGSAGSKLNLAICS